MRKRLPWFPLARCVTNAKFDEVNLVLLNESEVATGLPADDWRTQHLLQVVGLKSGESFHAGIIQGHRGIATITETHPRLKFTLKLEKEIQPQLPCEIIVGLPRPATAKKILYEGACLGVERILFFSSEKSDPSYAQSTLWKNKGWKEFLVKGAEQAYSTRLPEVIVFPTLAEALSQISRQSWRVALDPYEATSALKSCESKEKRGTLAIGSERGWTDRERLLLKESGFHFYHLGDRILRVEAACLVGTAIMLSQLNAWQSHRPIL